MKKAPAAPAITTTPMIVKRYVPMPPVDGRELIFVFVTGVVTSVGTVPAPFTTVVETSVATVVLVDLTYAGSAPSIPVLDL